MNYKFPIALKINSKSNSRLTGEVLIELANIKNINGNTDISQNYLTSNFVLKYNSKYSLTLGNSRNKNKNLLASRSRNNISELNIGYEFFKNKFFDKLTTQIGYYQTIIKSDSLNRKDKAFAILVRYYKNF